MNRDAAALLDIAKAAALVREFIAGFDQATFHSDLKTQSSVLYQLLVVGEAVKRLSHELRASFPAVPWSLVAGMRDHLIHAYDAIDWEEVWKTASEDLPGLLEQITPLLPDDPNGPSSC